MQAETRKPASYTPLPHAAAVKTTVARKVVRAFLEGANPRRLAREYGFSVNGVHELIRQNTRATGKRR